MRNIKFRGKTIKGDWVYGYLSIFHKTGNHFISNSAGMPFAFHVRPETVGQFTGLKDSGGQEIYEDDIINEDDFIGHVFYSVDSAAFYAQDSDCIMLMDFKESCFIIGNIHENPQLLK